ncbi:hypothetical protein ACR9YC_11155 [Parasphingorhabdus sp. DH2-15]|uniref:hypothetical protein n=1 Tax=Parasphingorhabdus sp. DH2-15 TaxID=3444112 RepID=UPI003F688365
MVAANSALPLRSMQWLKTGDADVSIVDAVNYTPEICLPAAATTLTLEGEILFRTPRLLGGQAAKARLSCQSCHINGADNPAFHFPNASSAPGTADVSNSFFSAKGGNGKFDPVPIPDLSASGKIARDKPGELEAFLANLIVTEFAGDTPDAIVVDALSSYVRSLGMCGENMVGRRTDLATDLMLVKNAALFADKRLSSDDVAIGHMLIAGGRDILGLIYERYAGGQFTAERQQLVRLSVDLQQIARTPDNNARARLVEIWHAQFEQLSAALQKSQSKSLYSPEMLQKRIDESR